MGLDMYLMAKKYHSLHGKEPRQIIDGFEVKESTMNIGQWRKHPNLHGFIVNNFANGIDDCKDIELDLAALKTTLQAVEADDLPITQGFFFGTSHPDDKAPTIEILNKAIAWLSEKDESSYRNVYYRASW